ncbi:hypothetical protein Q31a_45060 [Aureliella helgolandensis]|uniref:Uncharacterized protein n=1 Tax=Aureliella helgolandensis TaxID=2527968 RepID=A0A518GC20_9BACT|nr:hypothetical protein Q31a_45060 [Aureliella helgolandensis]
MLEVHFNKISEFEDLAIQSPSSTSNRRPTTCSCYLTQPLESASIVASITEILCLQQFDTFDTFDTFDGSSEPHAPEHDLQYSLQVYNYAN